MKTFEGCVLISDFDGTLIDAQGVISQQNIEAIKNFVEGGGLFCGATGRTQSNLGSHLDGLPVVAPWILYNGAAIYDFEKNRFLFTEPLNREMLRPLVRSIMETFENINTQVFTERMLYLVNPNGQPDVLLEAEGQPHEKRAMEEIKEPWLKMLFRGGKEELKAIEAILEAQLDKSQFRYFYSGDAYLEVTEANVSKGRGLQALRTILRERTKCILAIGDYYNDVEMLKWADVGAAPANAPEDIRELADVVTKDHNDHAVADLIQWLEERLKTESAMDLGYNKRRQVLEVCVDSFEGAKVAVEAGANRLELCAELSVGGLTPEMGLLARVASQLKVPVQVMIRPRSGGFVYTADEIETMRATIKQVKKNYPGIGGFVTGALTPLNTIDVTAMKTLIESCRPYPVTMHRAFDRLTDLEAGLETCIDLGLERILTSGGQPDVEAGLDQLKVLTEKAAGRIIILPGGGVNQDNAKKLMIQTGVKELHQSGRKTVKNGPHEDDGYQTVSREAIRKTKAEML